MIDASLPTYACVIDAWKNHEHELRKYLLKRIPDSHVAEDLLQEVFLKAVQQGEIFCCLNSSRSWLFRVTNNVIADHFRVKQEHVEIEGDIPAEQDEMAPIDGLAACVPRVLSELSENDREVLFRCDLQGMKQKDFAQQKGMTLPAVKARIQRARKRFQQRLTIACQVQLDEQGQVVSFIPRA